MSGLTCGLGEVPMKAMSESVYIYTNLLSSTYETPSLPLKEYMLPGVLRQHAVSLYNRKQ